MVKNKNTADFNYNNISKKDKNFMYKNLHRSNCYNSDFSYSNFNFVNFRGAHFKLCVFCKCTFKYAEFVGANLKDSIFKNAKFENTIFDSVNLEGVNFKDAEFKNTVFLNTDVKKAVNLDIEDSNIRIFDEMPKIKISEELETAVMNVMKNEYVKRARIFDTKDGKINTLNIMILLENFDEETLIKGLNTIQAQLDKSFYTLSYIIKLIKSYESDETI